MNEQITGRPQNQWTLDDSSLNTRLYLLAGKHAERWVVDTMTAECRSKFNQKPDLTPLPTDRIYYRQMLEEVFPPEPKENNHER